ncbi:S41 family peptidase [Xanthovirga aplysinae]|uniref:S41 family peptidase n=1 Tax=Xanthovirga aplysinae TaxID=2529853 RepID=UPI0012BCAE44|nr:S41 family peptidase [Xanthovirga aplysinae]MTI30330.1 hypothetical protein [Xanthovirga aplysinae]
MKSFFTFLLIFFSLKGISQDTLKNVVLSPTQAREDFDLYVQLLKETHPGLYRYQSEERINEVMDSISLSLKEDISFYDFYKLIARLNANIDCSHSLVLPTENFQKYLSRDIKSVPFYVIPVQDKVYILFNGTLNEDVKPGFELLSINGKPTSEITSEIKKYIWTDGDIELAKNFAMNGGLFPMFYYALIDRSEILKMKFADFDGKEIELEVSTMSTTTSFRNYKKNPVNKKVWKLYSKTRSKKWKFSFLKDLESTAKLVFPKFAGKNINNEEQAHAAMVKFMNHSLEKIQKKNIKNLIIDLRSNPGGWDIMGTTLMSYLLQKNDSISYYGPAYTVTDSTKFFKYSDLSEYNQKHVKDELIPQADGTFMLNPKYNQSHGYVHKNQNAFAGKIYLLINESTASAAAEFAAVAKSNGIGILVGSETNGTYGGQNGTSFVRMSLTHSKIWVKTPLVKVQNAVKSIQPMNRGVFPDNTVTFTIKNILERKDVQMEFVKNLIRNN